MAGGDQARGTKQAAGMTRRDFFAEIEERLRARTPAELSRFRTRANMNLLKIYFGNERIHYEVWTNGANRTIEVGLHFEDGPVSTMAYLEYFDRLIVELKHELGAQVELERWTVSWGHIYELHPLDRLTERLADQVATRLARMIVVLQPLVDDAAIPPERAALASGSDERRGPWRKWRR